jgi:predicted dehydrogenase
MRHAMLGCGSIGRRHLGNLIKLGEEDLVAYDPSESAAKEARDLYAVEALTRIEDVWDRSPDVVYVTAPSHLHLELALAAVRRGCHLFVEKPLAHQLEGLDELLDEVRDTDLITMVGCNTRFHHGPSTIKQLLDKGAVGKVVTAILDAGQYLPDWQPGSDYRERYSAHRSMGGGVLLDGIQELDYARWLFGEIEEVYCQGGQLSGLEMDTEDCVNVLVRFVAGMSVVLHLDCIQRTYSRSCKVIGEEGTINWDMTSPTQVRWYSAERESWTDVPPPEDYDVNEMYMVEMRHFLECLKNNRPTGIDVVEGARLTRIALAARESMETGRPISV